MVGSKDSIAAPNIVLDTIVAEAFSDACDELEKAEDFDRALQELIRRYLTQHQRIIFNGNGYSEDWVKEAEQRGLPNLPSMVDAIPALVTDRSVSMFEKFGVFSRSELESRVEIKYENYANIIHIEAMTMVDMASKSIIPAIVHWTGSLAGTIRDLESIGADTKVHRQLLDESGTLLTQTSEALQELIRLIRSEEKMPEGRDKNTVRGAEQKSGCNVSLRPFVTGDAAGADSFRHEKKRPLSRFCPDPSGINRQN